MADTLLTLQAVSERLGLSYKSVWNRIDQTRGVIAVSGKWIKATKDRGQWFVWQSDYDNPQSIVEEKPLLPATKAKPKRGRPPKRDWAIDFENLGDGSTEKDSGNVEE